MSYEKLFDAGISYENIEAAHKSGKKVLGMMCAFVPQEILHALDIMPVRMRATGCQDSSDAEVWMSSFSCSFARSVLQLLMDESYKLDGIIATDGCMQSVRIYDNWRWICHKQGREDQFIFELGVPRMYSPMTVNYFKSDLQEFIGKLEEFSGNKLDEAKLRHSVDLYNEQKALVRELLEFQKADHPVISGTEMLTVLLHATDYDVEEYNAMIRELIEDLKKRKPLEGYRARIMVIGSALDTPEYINTIEKKGGLVVADTLCFGSMTFLNDLVLGDDPLHDIAEFYVRRVVCPRMIDNRDELHDIVVKRAQEYKVNGVIYEKMQNCECWGGENVVLEQQFKDLGIPELTVEREQHLANLGQLEIRAEAFVEMIEEED